MDRAHIRGGEVVKLYNGEAYRIELTGGVTVSPLVIGWTNGADSIVEYELVKTDISTGPDTTVDKSRVVTANKVTDTRTKRDMTAQEIADRDAVSADIAKVELDKDKKFKAVLKVCWHIVKDTVPVNAKSNPNNFLTWVRSLV